jgi:hypothetical protein
MAKATDFISQLDVPVGYIGLDETVPQLIAAISDHEHSVWLARISERERSFRNFLKEACEGAGPEACKKAGIQADAPVRSPFAGIPLDKREMAICELHAALGNSTLPSLVRDPDSGYSGSPTPIGTASGTGAQRSSAASYGRPSASTSGATTGGGCCWRRLRLRSGSKRGTRSK